MLLLNAAFDALDPSWFDADPAPSTAGSAQPSPDEHKRLRRKISNRESARRCRMRKQRHLEELRAESARLLALNRDMASRVGDLSHRCLLFRRANHRLQVESAALSRRLDELRRLVFLRQVLMVTASPPLPLMAGLVAWDATRRGPRH